jgi:hypothetical protein
MLDAQGDEKLIPFIVHGKSQDEEVRNLPQFAKVIKGEENLAAFRAWVNQYDFQRPLVVPPNTPKERLQNFTHRPAKNSYGLRISGPGKEI